jgi:hypothetical protein
LMPETCRIRTPKKSVCESESVSSWLLIVINKHVISGT